MEGPPSKRRERSSRDVSRRRADDIPGPDEPGVEGGTEESLPQHIPPMRLSWGVINTGGRKDADDDVVVLVLVIVFVLLFAVLADDDEDETR